MKKVNILIFLIIFMYSGMDNLRGQEVNQNDNKNTLGESYVKTDNYNQNYLAKWTSDSKPFIGNSLITDNGNKITILAPISSIGNLLEVNGSFKTTNEISLNSKISFVNSISEIQWGSKDESLFKYFKFNSFDGKITKNIMTLDGNRGYVGIGTETPDADLHVNGRILTTNFTMFNEESIPVNGYVLTCDAEGNGHWAPGGTGSGTSPWLPNVNDIYFNTGGVGIGTINPQYLLHVNGDAYTKELIVDGNFAATGKFYLNKTDAEINWGAETYGNLSFNAITGLSVRGIVPPDPSAQKTIMTLDGENAFVGIGTETPETILHIHKRTKPQITLSDDFGNLVFAIAENSWDFAPTSLPGDAVIRTHNKKDHHGIIFNINNEFNDGTGYIKFNDNHNHNTLTILNNGNVGIGIANPTYQLHVTGATFTKYFTLFDATNPPLDGYILQSDASGNARWAEAPATSPWLACGTSDIHFSEGSVGIGTTNTGEYKLAVNGSINAKLIKISLNVPSSDYVFKEDYKLMSLYDLEMFVNKNQHLPEVKSAEEFKEEGYNIGDMDDVLLRKVEELTLYTIEQQKQLDKQQQVVDLLMKQIIELEKKLNKNVN